VAVDVSEVAPHEVRSRAIPGRNEQGTVWPLAVRGA